MRKNFFICLLLAIAGIMVTGCSSCKSENKKQDVVAELDVDNVISTDREWMFLNADENYKWYETSVTLKNFLDEENDGTVESITDVFQTNDPKVFIISHDSEGDANVEIKCGFYVDDFEMDSVVIGFKDAFDKLMDANYPKPHSRQCVLRKQVGPKPCNAQYIFGNTREQLYVDAVTGDVSDINPAFGE